MLWSSTWTCKCCYVRWNFESRGDWPLLKQLPPQESPITGAGRNKNCPQSSLCGVHLCKYTPSYTPIRSSIYNAVRNTHIENQFRNEREKYHKHPIKVPEFPMQGGALWGEFIWPNMLPQVLVFLDWQLKLFDNHPSAHLCCRHRSVFRRMFVQPFKGEKVILHERGCWEKNNIASIPYSLDNTLLKYIFGISMTVRCTMCALSSMMYTLSAACPVVGDHSLRSCLTTGFSLAAGRGHTGHEDKWDEAHLHRDDLPMSIQTRFIILTSICWKNQPKAF